MTPHDLKQYGTEPTMPRGLVNFCLGLAALIAVLTAYALVADERDRKVVTLTLTTTEYAQALDRARKQGETDTLARMRACNWNDTFREEPPLRRRAR